MSESSMIGRVEILISFVILYLCYQVDKIFCCELEFEEVHRIKTLKRHLEDQQ